MKADTTVVAAGLYPAVDTEAEIERLEERRHRLMNSYGNGSYEDGYLTSEIASIDERLAALDALRTA